MKEGVMCIEMFAAGINIGKVIQHPMIAAQEEMPVSGNKMLPERKAAPLCMA